MFKRSVIGGWLLAGLVATLSTSLVRADDEPGVVRARALLKLLLDDKVEELVAAGDEAVQAKLTAPKLREAWSGLTFSLGKYEAEESVKLTEVKAHQSVRFTLRFERGKQPVTIVLDAQGRMAGLWFGAPEMTVKYEAPDYVGKDAFREEKVTVAPGAEPLPGTLTTPVGNGPWPAVVLVHGSGPHDEDETVGVNKPFRDLAWGLGSRGIAVLRYEKRTKAYLTSKKVDEWTLASETIDDAVAAAELLRQRPEVDPKRVFVAGHSLGGMAAPFIGQNDPKLAGLIIMAGSARSILDLLDDQYVYLAKLDGTVSPEDQQQIDKIHQMTKAVREGRLADVAADATMPVNYLAELHQLHPAEAAESLTMPILIVQGGRDYQVTQPDWDLWKKHLDGRKNVTFKRFDDLNHLFITGSGPSGPQEYQQAGHVAPAVIETLAAWIAAQPARP